MISLAALCLAGCVVTSPPDVSAAMHEQSAVASRGFFYIGGKYTGDPGKQIMAGQIFVEVIAPKKVRRQYPLVLIHGAAQTATNWMGTPDGRQGWADYFVEQGYIVYLIDQPMRGRSAWHPSDGPTRMVAASEIERQFTAAAELGDWPQAGKHTQWPGKGPLKGRRGDPIFDAFYATQVESLASAADTQLNAQAAGAALLDRIGPAILLTHSQAGPIGWLIADIRPDSVKGIVALEPSGPPFGSSMMPKQSQAWGPTDISITYRPAAVSPDELMTDRVASSSPGLTACWMQQAPARQLVNLTHIPVAIMVAEASYHAAYDHCTAAYLTQAGVNVNFMRLEDLGVFGNGHMMMIEKNNLQIADIVDTWLQEHVR